MIKLEAVLFSAHGSKVVIIFTHAQYYYCTIIIGTYSYNLLHGYN